MTDRWTIYSKKNALAIIAGASKNFGYIAGLLEFNLKKTMERVNFYV